MLRTLDAPAAFCTSLLVRIRKPKRPLPEKVRRIEYVPVAEVRACAVSTSRPSGVTR